jgi:hypothetical protein
MSTDVTTLYLEHRQLIDRWAEGAEHPLLRACALVIKNEALLELGVKEREADSL